MSYTLLFQGDSITDGNRYKDPSTFWDLNHYLGHGYAEMCAGKLAADYPEADFRIHNRGLSGNRVIDLHARWDVDAYALKPDILSILIGVNDCGHALRCGIKSVAKKYDKYYRLLLDETYEQLPDVKLILMEPFILPVKTVAEQREEWESLLKPLQELLPAIAEEYKAVYVPLQDRFNELAKVREPSYWMWDGIHPTTAGHEILSREWMKGFMKLGVV